MIEVNFWIAFAGIAVLVVMVIGCLVMLVRPEEENEQGVCWACGRSGNDLSWYAVDAAPQSNQRVSYLVHAHCTELAEKQAGL